VEYVKQLNNMIHNPKVYADKSPIHGWGVFAKEDIMDGELFEECPILQLPLQFGEVSPLLIDYRFNWPSGVAEWEEQVVALGFGSLYNHSETPNAYWYSDQEKRTFKFVSNREIKKGEEIFVWYGDVGYWNDGRTHTNVI
jgi:SET domain-containing protein